MFGSCLKILWLRAAPTLVTSVAALAAVALSGIEIAVLPETSAKAADLAARPPNLWDVDISGKGTYCIVDPDHVHLWRAATDKPAKLRISGPANSPSAIVEFNAGAAVAAIDPATFPISDGSTMTVSDPVSGAVMGEIDFAILPSQPNNPEQLAEALKMRGCTAQFQQVPSTPAPRE
jgi:hypothetical protein